MHSPLRIVIVDDHGVIRDGLRSVLGREADMKVVGAAPNAEAGLAMIGKLNPDVAVIDYGLPDKSGTELCAEISKLHPKVKVVVLTTFLDDNVVRGSIQAGAHAYVYKDVEATSLKNAIRTAANGSTVIDPRVSERVKAWTRRGMPPAGTQLTRREIDVLRRVARGLSNREAAEEMCLTENTAKTYMKRILSKLACTNRREAVALARKKGLL